MTDQITDLLGKVEPKTGSGKYLDQLTDEGREVLEDFETWLRTEDPKGLKAESTAKAYKGYVAKAIVELERDPDFELDSDVMSAINCLRRFKVARLGDEPAPNDVPASGDKE
jgi:hypothetical protein